MNRSRCNCCEHSQNNLNWDKKQDKCGCDSYNDYSKNESKCCCCCFEKEKSWDECSCKGKGQNNSYFGWY